MPDSVLNAFSTSAIKHLTNTQRTAWNAGTSLFSEEDLKQSRTDISGWTGYRSTPLHDLNGLASALGIRSIQYKDEGERFGLGSFKALGGAYAVSKIVQCDSNAPDPITVTTATDGNHGLSVAWGAKNHGYRAVVYIHAEVSRGREQALKSLGAEVVRIDGNYDESVRTCYRMAADNGWSVISDTTSADLGRDVARTVMMGYSVMLTEVIEQLAGKVPTHVFVQGGVGGLAATVCECFRISYRENAPRFIVVEPELADCLFQSAAREEPTAVNITEETIMAGLSCGEVSSVAWPVLFHHADDFMTIPDTLVAPAMRLLGDAPFGDQPIVAGESAVAGLAGLVSASVHPEFSRALKLNEKSRILVIGTEGATDAEVYATLTGRSADSIQLDKTKSRNQR